MESDRTQPKYLEMFLEYCSCPISLELMYYPVTIPCGHTFQADNLAHWMKNNSRCPLCRVRFMYNQNSKVNENIKRACDLYEEQKVSLGKVESVKRFQIFIKSQKISTIQIGDGDTISSIMMKLALKRGSLQMAKKFPYKLQYVGKVLRSDLRVRDYGIQPLATLMSNY